LDAQAFLNEPVGISPCVALWHKLRGVGNFHVCCILARISYIVTYTLVIPRILHCKIIYSLLVQIQMMTSTHLLATMNTTLYINGSLAALEGVTRKGQEISFSFQGKFYHFSGYRLPDGRMMLEREVAEGVWQRRAVSVWQSGKENRVQIGSAQARITEQVANNTAVSRQAELSPKAPMPGLVRQVLVKVGDTVAQGQAIVVMEAMKLQMTLAAGDDAVVEAVLAREGEMVSEGAELIRLKRQERHA